MARIIHDFTHPQPTSAFVRFMIPFSIMGSLSMLIWMAACNTLNRPDPNSAAAKQATTTTALGNPANTVKPITVNSP